MRVQSGLLPINLSTYRHRLIPNRRGLAAPSLPHTLQGQRPLSVDTSEEEVARLHKVPPRLRYHLNQKKKTVSVPTGTRATQESTKTTMAMIQQQQRIWLMARRGSSGRAGRKALMVDERGNRGHRGYHETKTGGVDGSLEKTLRCYCRSSCKKGLAILSMALLTHCMRGRFVPAMYEHRLVNR